MTDKTNCALCSSTDELSTYNVPSRGEPLLVCEICRPQIEGAELDPNHWYCLQEAAWSDVPAVQVVAWRLLNRLSNEGWANDLLDQLYIEEDVLTWAKEGADNDSPSESDKAKVVDSNGTELQDGDSVTIIKDLPVKGAGFTAKRGTLVRNIRLGNDPTHIEGRVNKVAILLKTAFLKKTT